mmetsp:Transcript_32183/g.58698  ORF Transcript_32183/g.58698 Transcript_32183/m.58698 type:complete len:222 (+) Transcript_32183:63-728(+)
MKEAERRALNTGTPSTHSATPRQTWRSSMTQQMSDNKLRERRRQAPMRRGASGAPAPRAPHLHSARLPTSASRGKSTSSIRAKESGSSSQRSILSRSDSEEDQRRRPEVPSLSLQHIISMRDMFGDLDMKHDYKCNSPASSVTTSAFTETDASVAVAPTDRSLHMTIEDVGVPESARLPSEPVCDSNSLMCRLLRAVLPQGCGCSQAPVDRVPVGGRVSSV